MLLDKLPQVIILYGPPAAGKGTQSHILKEKLPKYYHLDFGSQLRKFVSDNLGDYLSNEEKVNPNSPTEDIEVARRIKRDMKKSLPVQTPDLRYVIEKGINDCIARGQGMIVEGPGRLIEEAQWLSGFLASKSVEVCIFHLYISLEEVLERAKIRHYLPSTKKPFRSYEEATKNAISGEVPFRRHEDEDIEGTKQRYRLLYSDNFATIISIYQLTAKALVFNLDARKEIQEVSDDILKYFQVFYQVDLN